MDNLDIKILWIDDEADFQDGCEYIIRKAGFTPLIATTAKQGIRYYCDEIQDIALVLCDFKMPEMNGFELRKTILPFGDTIPFAIISSFVTKEMALEALSLKITAFYDKPYEVEEIIRFIQKESFDRIQFIREYRLIESVFIEEAYVILDEMEPDLISLNYDRGNHEVLKTLARCAHTLKGSSGCLNSNVLTKYMHKYEDIISALLKKEISLTDQIYEILFKGLDRIKELVKSISNKQIQSYKLETILPEILIDISKIKEKENFDEITLKENIPTVQIQEQKLKDNISVPVHMLDELSNNSGEITVLRNMVNKIIRSLELKYTQNKDIQNLGELFDEMHKINSKIQSRITDLCKVPLSGVLKPIPRIIRDLSRDLGKDIKLDIFGDSMRIDNSLAQVCSNSLIHLVRNSVDHGIETVEERLKNKKTKIGTIKIQCSEDNNIVQINISDDGRGIDQNKIVAKAIEKGLYTKEQLESLSEQQIFEIIFASGFSTAEKLTDVSGRGVGMDMVKSSVEACGGQIVIESRVNFGTEFKLLLPKPKSVLIIQSLLINCADQCFAIPQDSIFRVLRIDHDNYRSMIQKISTEDVLKYEEILYPIVNLKKILKISKKIDKKFDAKNTILEILILKTKDLMFAMQVDEILDSEEIVLKEINQCFNFQRIYSGATFMGDGTIGLILNIKNIAELAGIKLNKHNKSPERNEIHLLDKKIETSDFQNYLLFHFESNSIYGIPLSQVFRLEEIPKSKIQLSGTKKVVIYRDSIMPIYTLENLLNLTTKLKEHAIQNECLSVIVTKNEVGYKGYVVSEVLDIASGSKDISHEIRDRVGIIGNTFIHDKTVTILDISNISLDS